jgi:hypothetical protein
MHRVVIIKPSKYGVSGFVERFRRGFMPNSTLAYIRSMTPRFVDDVPVETIAVDEYVQTDLRYLDLLRHPEKNTLLALVGVQSHQFQRSLDLAAFARAHGVRNCVIGGPHPMTCDTTMLHNRGISFALAEAENIWLPILRDAIRGELLPSYGAGQRWAAELSPPVLMPPSRRDMRRYVVPMLGVYPARGCPFTCNFCSVIKIAGRNIRMQSLETTIESLRRAKAAGVRLVMFTSDNFNKYPEATELLERMIEEDVRIPVFVQCDTQVAKQPYLIELLGKVGCFQMFVGVESFNRKALLQVHKAQNHPEKYAEIVKMCREFRVPTHFSNIIGFPGETTQSVVEHVSVLKELGPDIASFYILTPIPGTQQYDDFKQRSLLIERNLDRYDGTSMVWQHDRISGEDMPRLLFEAYRRFYSNGRVLRSQFNWVRVPLGMADRGEQVNMALPLFCRFAASRKMHPMAGGFWNVHLDHVTDYLPFRRSVFDVDLAPLPDSLALSSADEELNAHADALL